MEVGLGRRGIGVLLMLASLTMLTSTCGGGQGTETPTNGGQASGQTRTPEATPDEPVIITIGNLTDLTGASAAAMDLVNKAVKDVAAYYNDQNLIPGVILKVIEYDTKFDPAQEIPGYEWLRNNGADVIWSGIPSAPSTLQDRVTQDRVCLFSPAVSREHLVPGGYIFCVAVPPEDTTYTSLSWIAENDWDYGAKGPARVGGAGWSDYYSPIVLSAAEEYCQAHPDQFEWIGGYVTNFSFSWGPQVEALKDADYVFPPNVMTNFIKQYREIGGEGKLVLGEPNLAFIGQLADAGLWNEADGSLVLRNTLWWDDKGPLVDWTKQLLYTYRPDRADAIKEVGVGYLGAMSAYQMVEAMKLAVETVGAVNFTPEALYRAIQELSLTVDGVERFSFSTTKRCSTNYYVMYEFNAAKEDLVRVSDEWYPARMAP